MSHARYLADGSQRIQYGVNLEMKAKNATSCLRSHPLFVTMAWPAFLSNDGDVAEDDADFAADWLSRRAVRSGKKNGLVNPFQRSLEI
jgi:hypothetical protein